MADSLNLMLEKQSPGRSRRSTKDGGPDGAVTHSGSIGARLNITLAQLGVGDNLTLNHDGANASAGATIAGAVGAGLNRICSV